MSAAIDRIRADRVAALVSERPAMVENSDNVPMSEIHA